MLCRREIGLVANYGREPLGRQRMRRELEPIAACLGEITVKGLETNWNRLQWSWEIRSKVDREFVVNEIGNSQCRRFVALTAAIRKDSYL
jgi:hypothetical protein